MRDIKYILEDIRESTENTQFSENTGISDRELLLSLNEGLQYLQSEIVKRGSKIFVKDYVTTVGGNRRVDLPNDTYLNARVVDVDYRRQSTNNWSRVNPSIFDLRERYVHKGTPETYTRRTGYISLDPEPDSGEIRIAYIYKLPSADLQRAVVLSSDLDNVNFKINNLFLDLDNPDVGVNFDVLKRNPYITICDMYGNIKMNNILVRSLDEDTGEIIINPDFIFEEGQLIEAGDYVLSGKNASNFLYIDDHLERFLRIYVETKVFKREGSSEYVASVQSLQTILNDIVEMYADISDDVYLIPDINEDFDEFS